MLFPQTVPISKKHMPPLRAREKTPFFKHEIPPHKQFAAPCFCCVLPSFALLSSHSHPPVCVCVCFRSRAKKRTTHLYTARRDVKKKPKEYSHIFAGKFFSKGRISAKIHHFFPHLSRVTRTETNTHENSPHGQCETLSANVTFLSSRQKISTPRRGHCFFAIWLFS